jgi:hypothetical protein
MYSRPVTRAGVFAAGLLGTAGMSAGVIGLGGAGASAAPVNAQFASTGTFDCGPVGSGTYVINNGNGSNHAAMVWTAAHVTFADGRTGVFQPSAFDFGGGAVSQKNAPGSTVCGVVDSNGNAFTVAGQVIFTP